MGDKKNSAVYCKVLPLNFLSHSYKSPTEQMWVLKNQGMFRQVLVVLHCKTINDH